FFHRTDAAFRAPYTAEGMAKGAAAAAAVTTANLRLDLRASIDWLAAQPFVVGSRIGVWGFCMGASVAFLAAMEPGISCAICFYGAQIARPWRNGEPGALEQAAELKAPLLLAFGGRDHSIPPDAVAAIESTLQRLGKRYELIMYPDADHAFFRSGGSDRDRTEVADAWRRARAFLAAELGYPPRTGRPK
ncbi:MAG: dienelactone hydrolase family protein, partial [Candidatus Eremiobacteraeota bacterium]|nr:dienelactone hydrolase family protein [Candidatus Eremiobacteraeota bacterium]